MHDSMRCNEVSRPEQAAELRGLAERVVVAYALVDWGGSDHAFQRTHNEFKAAMRELKAYFERVKVEEKDGGVS
jgi:hypothetical protein